MTLEMLDRFPWDEWALILEEGDQYFDEAAVKERKLTRAVATAECATEEEAKQVLKNLYPLHAFRIMAHSQHRSVVYMLYIYIYLIFLFLTANLF